VTLTMARGAIAVAAAITVGGCGGGEAQAPAFAPADAARIATVRPVRAGWTWPKNSQKHVWSGSQTDAQATDPLDVGLRRQTAGLVSLGGAANKWRDSDKLANLYAEVFASPADAHELMGPLNAYSRGWGERSGHVDKDEVINGLGDEAWLLRTEGNGTEVTYHWRRENLVVEAHLHCFGFCPDDINAAARAWVDAIDEEVSAAG
jgi:hypothetical protein